MSNDENELKPYELPKDQRVIINLAMGKDPENEKESKLRDEIRDGLAKGWTLDLPLE